MTSPLDKSSEKVVAFIARWQGQEGGQERANYSLFLTERCDVLGLPRSILFERNIPKCANIY
jgi:hypothetical protein